jgi:hypothetical protein
MSNYRCISNFGPKASNSPSTNPLSYCLLQTVDNGFNHGGMAMGIDNAYGQQCQVFMSEYCANKWDGICEFKSKDSTTLYPNSTEYRGVPCYQQTFGENLIANTAARKYLIKLSNSCPIKYEPFDPTVASSPLISMWGSDENCQPQYGVDPTTIDSDPVMNKILAKPIIAWSILVNIYNTAKRNGKLNSLRGTKLYKLFMFNSFQNYVNKL